MSQVVRYTVDDGAVVMFEVDPPDEFALASTDQVIGAVRNAIGPALEAAREVLDRVKEYGPRDVEVKFGIKVSGTMNWFIAKAATEGNFEVTLKWGPGGPSSSSA